MREHGILRRKKSRMNNTVEAVKKGRLTHPSENARNLKNEVEFSAARNFAGTFRSLKGLGFQL